MSPASPMVFVVDDDNAVRASVELLIRSAGWRPEGFASAGEFLSRGRVEGPSCLVLDVNLPDLSGLDVQRLLADRTVVPIVFITKPFDAQALLAAVRQALERSSATLARQAEIERLRCCYESLSRREREVMALIVDGRLNKQVGGELGISEITVKAHRGKMMRKMQAVSLADLIKKALTLRLDPLIAA